VSQDTSTLRVEQRERVAVVTLARPDQLNAIGSDTLADLDAVLTDLETDADVRAFVITGVGRA